MKNILIAGNSIFTKDIIKKIHTIKSCKIFVLTGSSKKNPVLEYVIQNNINYITIEDYNWESIKEYIKNNYIDLVITLAFGKIIPQKILQIPKYGFINIHLSLLPKWRGATPIQAALLNGEETTGVTIQKMVYQMDAGPILKKYPIHIDINDDHNDVLQKMSDITCDDIENFLNLFFTNKITFISQNENEATFCKILDFTREMGKINWNNTSISIYNKIRAFYPEPISWSIFNNKILNIRKSKLSQQKSQSLPGEIFFINKKLFVSTYDNDLEILELVLEGKKIMTGVEFGNGIVQKNKIRLI